MQAISNKLVSICILFKFILYKLKLKAFCKLEFTKSYKGKKNYSRFCIFICILAYFIGNAQIALILDTNEYYPDLNQTSRNSSYDYGASCGSSNCPKTKFDSESVKYKTESVYGLCGALDVLMILAMMTTVIFMDDIKVNDKSEKIEHKSFGSKTFGIKNKNKLISRN